MLPVALRARLSPVLSATRLSALTGSRGEAQWGICALSRRSLKWPRTTFKAYALDFRTQQLSWAVETLWVSFTCASTLEPSHSRVQRCSKRPINPWSVIIALQASDDVIDTPKEVCGFLFDSARVETERAAGYRAQWEANGAVLLYDAWSGPDKIQFHALIKLVLIYLCLMINMIIRSLFIPSLLVDYIYGAIMGYMPVHCDIATIIIITARQFRWQYSGSASKSYFHFF